MRVIKKHYTFISFRLSVNKTARLNEVSYVLRKANGQEVDMSRQNYFILPIVDTDVLYTRVSIPK